VIHTLRVNCAETIQDRPGQPAYEMFCIKCKFRWCKSRPPTCSSSPLYECIKFGYPLQNARFLLLSSSLAREQLQIDTDLLRTITSTADELCGGSNIDYLERPWTPKIEDFSELFAILGCDTHLEWIVAEITGDRPRQPHTKLNWCCRASHEH